MLKPTTRNPLKKEKIVLRDIGDEAVLYNPQTKAIHVLNKTSSMVWESCDGKHSLKMIEKKIMDKFDVSSAQDVKDDIIETLNKFSELGLIEQ
ncbi:MAG: PqqD family protein [Pseudomonadota bacterium]